MSLAPKRSPSTISQSEHDPDVLDWRPGGSSAATWTVVGIAVTVLGLPVFSLPSILRVGPTGSFRIGLVDVLLVLALTTLLVIASTRLPTAVFPAGVGCWDASVDLQSSEESLRD